ncbi:hypothetical protein H257_18898 [Aphanomyces astaci]|uniref:Uncharacterized protein n=1 Tax=Aphanomyces astaci TaxID=112090 RepID=W4FBU9_APHAT|nr:hypothetical protein H257_18898 [Aphanomyces astaci]ETV64178.1 hypothetical protein H257_18898 [Aphanomyces astaci]|eukprot:XP_009846339.1 hypothetical protein H257_18898 [Aphanomyces astaci]
MRKRQRTPKNDRGRVTGSRSREDAPLGAPLRTRSDLPDDNSYLLSTSGNRHMVAFAPLPQPEEYQLSQRLSQLLLHQRLKKIALQCRCQPTQLVASAKIRSTHGHREWTRSIALQSVDLPQIFLVLAHKIASFVTSGSKTSLNLPQQRSRYAPSRADHSASFHDAYIPDAKQNLGADHCSYPIATDVSGSEQPPPARQAPSKSVPT